MRMFWQQPTARSLSAKLANILIKERGLSVDDGASLRMLERRGNYSGRPVTYFRIFDPVAVQAAGITARRYADLDQLTDLFTGHTERDGAVVLNGDGAWHTARERSPH